MWQQGEHVDNRTLRSIQGTVASDSPDTVSCALPSASPETHPCLPSYGPSAHDAGRPLLARPLPPGCVQLQAVPKICGPGSNKNKSVTARLLLITHLFHIFCAHFFFLVIPVFPQMPVAKVVFPPGASPVQNNPPFSLVTLVSVTTRAVLSATPLLPEQLFVQDP